MSQFKKILIATLSLAPSTLLIMLFFFEPFFYASGLLNRAEFPGSGDIARLISAVMIYGMIYFYGRYTFTTEDPRLAGKKSLWIWILILGNVISVPIFWYLFFKDRYNNSCN